MMAIKCSSKINAYGEFVHNDQTRFFQRMVGGICFPGESQGCAIVLAEEKAHYGDTPNRFLVAETFAGSDGELVAHAIFLGSEFKVDRWYGKLTRDQREYLILNNRDRFKRNMQQLYISEAPGPEGSESITQHVSLLVDNLQPENKKLWLFDDSSLPAMLAGLPSALYQLRAVDAPGPAALGYCLSSMINFTYDEANLSAPEPEPDPEY